MKTKLLLTVPSIFLFFSKNITDKRTYIPSNSSLKSFYSLIFTFFICFGIQAEIYNGNLTLTSQAGVDAFDYTEVTGNSISGTITIDEEFIPNNFGVAAYDATMPFNEYSAIESGMINPDGTYTIDLSGVDASITDFIILFISASHINEFYNDIPFDQPQNAALVQRGATNINAHLISNFISGTITVDDEFNAGSFGVAVYQAGVPFNLSSILAQGNPNPDGTYLVDLSAVDKSVTEFIVLFISERHIYEFYDNIPFDQPQNAVVVQGGSTGINAHLQSNSIKGTITAEDEFINTNFGVAALQAGAPFDLSSILAEGLVNLDGTYSVDLSEVDRSINDFNIFFVSAKHIWEYYDDIYYWENLDAVQNLSRGATNVDAYLNTNTIKGTITLDEGELIPEEFDVAVYEKGTLDPLRTTPPVYLTTVETDGTFVVDLSEVDYNITELIVLFIGKKYILEFYNDVPWQNPESSQMVRRGETGINAQLIYDHIPPVLTVNDLTFNNDYGKPGASVLLSASATDNSGMLPIISYIPESRSFFSLGTTKIVATATDGAGNQDTKSFTVTVLDNEPPEITAPDIIVDNDFRQAGANVTFEVSATDNSGDDPSITFSHVSGSFFPLGTTQVNCTATDGSGNIANKTFTVTVLDKEPPVITSPDITVNNDPDKSGANVTLNVSAEDNSGVTPVLTCTRVSGFFSIGTTTVECTATDAANNKTVQSFTVTVLDVEPPTLTVTSITVNNDAGQPGANVTLSATSSDNSGIAPNLEFNPASESFFPLGTTTVECTATDAANNKTVQSFTVTVLDVEPPPNEIPKIISINAPIDPVQVEAEVNISAIFTDDNLSEASLDWGDGKSSSGIINGTSITGKHQYLNPGVFTLTLTISDSYDEIVNQIYQYIVIYDPSGGFVTGGGLINSPIGAYIDNPLLEGKANFGFVAKYKKGQTVPTGNTEFQFKAGDLKFNSSLFDWLVIAGTKAKFKGVGTINGMGSYGFMISAIDEDSKDKIDKFRIKIWDMANEDVVYDNQNGAEDNSDPTTEIGGGAIVVHAGKGNNVKISDSKIEPMEEEGISGLNVVYWPNPTDGYFNLELKTNNRVDKVNIYVFDLNRRLVHVDKFDVNQQYQFGDRLQSGIYFVKLSQANSTKTIRVVKY